MFVKLERLFIPQTRYNLNLARNVPNTRFRRFHTFNFSMLEKNEWAFHDLFWCRKLVYSPELTNCSFPRWSRGARRELFLPSSRFEGRRPLGMISAVCSRFVAPRPSGTIFTTRSLFVGCSPGNASFFGGSSSFFLKNIVLSFSLPSQFR